MTANDLPSPYSLPIWRRSHREASPNGKFEAVVDPAHEVSMGNPTSGTLRIEGTIQLERCSPAFVWSDDSRYLAVPQFGGGFLRRQRLLIVDMLERRVYRSKGKAPYFQPESFREGEVVVTENPSRRPREIRFHIPGDLGDRFSVVAAQWSEGAAEAPDTGSA